MQRFYVVKEVVNDKLKRRYEFVVSNEYLEKRVADKLSEIAQNVRVDGFRKGKVSPEIVRRSYGQSVEEDVLSQVIEDVSSEFMKEKSFDNVITSELKIISRPKVCSEGGEDGDLVYELRFELMPEAPLLDFDAITIKEVVAKISQEDIDGFLDELKKEYREFVVPDDEGYGASAGDKIVFDYRSSFMGKALRGGSADGVDVVLGSSRLLKGFEDQVVGMKKGEQKCFELEFPEEYQSKTFAGKKVDMSVKVGSVMVPKEVNSNEELAKGYGFKSVEAMFDFATKALEGKFKRMSFALMKKELFDYVDAEYTTEVPESVVSKEVDRIRQELKAGEITGLEEEDVPKEANRRVRLGVLLMKVSQGHNVSVEPQDIVAFLRANYSHYGSSLESVAGMLRSNNEFRDRIRGKVLEDKVVNYIIAKVKRERQDVSAADLKLLFENI